MNIVITAKFDGEAKTSNVFSIENATAEVVAELVGLAKGIIDDKESINVSLDVVVDGTSVASASRPMTQAETAQVELRLVEALKTFISNHNGTS